ncbi:MAG: hypothetical protein A3F94_00425 [Candidatus Spechtbacteria bacterium RIFCSPLOWO2_12_FULL_38_22]|uniref:Type 4 fimbrial biogenesis protein PilX N-terminal domain-containing protein n=1 Tax=Candidatus Spechtbacteria bacterium RIFCSPLOWO2_12_FULL_38_22 TaxID=1802165 RepID=A0A1G2HIR1_9BACT|nr:MAG: hypothetical protein A3A00_02930 [Candidatus Spechtbacteria bacterium RIFCSPLOWO2_01_FULL_38_20]OGZ60314.1 MAG: hypothetical protein A3E58_02935 [Candidatus Spechtbacteria bacterium RIFCSPHIGHO2_12_FULL_38_30]OGZ62289.1 MAG: hypothetical protein A3F94_00425 [Candidatus Spechtbacteria bacterium RIFCSPLOWO2_12_FULL_38_22]
MFNDQRGVIALSITIIILFIGITIVFSSVFVFLNRIEIARNVRLSEQAYFAAESVVEDALLRFIDPNKTEISSYPYSLAVGGASASIDKTTVGTISTFAVVGNASNRTRSLGVGVSGGVPGTTFSYAAQIGQGGLVMNSNSEVEGDVYSNGNITGFSNSVINGNATAVGTISSPRPSVSGTKIEGADIIALPPFDEQGWKDAANINNDPYIGNLSLDSGTTVLGPKKIEGNLTLNSNADLIVQGVIHVTGNFSMNSGSDLFLDDDFGSTGTVIIVEGTISFNSNADVFATDASPKGYIMFVSMSNNTDAAIQLNSNADLEAALYAVNGGLSINSNGEVVSLVVQKLILNSNAEIDYDLGLINYSYSTGGAGSYDIISWKEQ